MKQIDELIERLEKATGPDRVIDGLVWKLCEEKAGDDWQTMGSGIWHRRDPDDTVAFDVPPKLTASIDAALALVERRFSAPEHFVELSIGKAAYCEIHSQSVYDELGKGEAATAPLAILIALLRATEPSNGGTA